MKNATEDQISELIFEEIETHLSPQMTFKKETDTQVIFTWGHGTMHMGDINRINAIARIYNLTFCIRERDKCIDVEIDKVY